MKNEFRKPASIPGASLEALFAHAAAFYGSGQFEKALESYDAIIVHHPRNAEAHHNRGAVLHHLKRQDAALASFDKAIALNPRYADAYRNRGTVLYSLKKYKEALESLSKAIAINPDDAQAHNTRATVLQYLNRPAEALESLDKVIALQPGFYMAYNNRGVIRKLMRQHDAALADYDKAISINPAFADAYWNKSTLKLLLGEYEEGWKLYEWRWKKSDMNPSSIRNFKQPLWLGRESLEGKTLLLYAEEGFGDMIQFCRYIPMVEAMGARVIVEVPAPLVDLISTLSTAIHVVARGTALPEFDFQSPFMSLPHAFGTRMDTIPAGIPYLSVDAEKEKIWQERLGAGKRHRIGLVWSGRAVHTNDHNRSIALRALIPLLGDRFDFFMLQTEVRDSDVDALAGSRITSHAEHLKDFSDTAALVSEMDLVVSVDTSVVHLAGALGKSVWVLLPYEPDFRWLLEREDSPWYPTARLFRQPSAGDWDSVIARVKKELSDAFSR